MSRFPSRRDCDTPPVAVISDAALDAAVNFLASRREADGRFVDFQMEPGASDGWITAYVALCLFDATDALGTRSAARAEAAAGSAAEALLRMRRPGGWGYNHRVATDADSTAFALRALLRAGLSPHDGPVVLRAYVNAHGAAHTFRGRDPHGDWAGAHVDVTASVGVALAEYGDPDDLRDRMARWTVAALPRRELWQGYWWTSPCYTTALVAEWLHRERRLQPLRERLVTGIQSIDGTMTVFDVACLVDLLARLGERERAVPLVRMLLAWQQPDGGWPASAALRLPDPHASTRASSPSDTSAERCHGTSQMHDASNQSRSHDSVPVFADERRLFTTATALRTLSALRPVPMADRE